MTPRDRPARGARQWVFKGIPDPSQMGEGEISGEMSVNLISGNEGRQLPRKVRRFSEAPPGGHVLSLAVPLPSCRPGTPPSKSQWA